MLTLTPELARRFDPLISLALPFFRGVMNNFSQTPQFKDFEQAIDYLDSFDFKIHFLFDEFEQTSKNPNLGEPFFRAPCLPAHQAWLQIFPRNLLEVWVLA
jgi:hypothetical protein